MEDIVDLRVKYVTKGVVHKLRGFYYCQNNLCNILDGGLGIDFELCDFLWLKLLENLEKTKSAKYPFMYVSLIICLVFMFMNELPDIGNKVWDKFHPIGMQIK